MNKALTLISTFALVVAMTTTQAETLSFDRDAAGALEYTLIVRYEEGVLESIFGAEYLAYKGATPRWLPRPPRRAESGAHEWGEAWRSELSTFMQYAALAAAFAVKARVF